MARFSRALTAALTNPSYQQGLFTAGAALGGVGTGMQAAQNRRREDAAMASMMQAAGTGSMGQTKMAEMAMLASENPNVDMTKPMAMLEARKKLAEQQKDARTTRLQQEAKAGQARTIAQKLRAMGETDLGDIVAQASSMDQVPEGIRKAVSAVFAKEKLNASPSVQSVKGTIKTSTGHHYNSAVMKDGTSRMVPVAGAPPFKSLSPEEQNSFEYVDTKYGESSGDRMSRDVDTAEQKVTSKNFVERQSAAIDEVPVIRDNMAELRDAVALLDSVDTGGPVNAAALGIEKFTGEVSADKGELLFLLGKAALSQLKPTFGGSQITDSERKALTDLFASGSKGTEENRAILGKLIEQGERSLRRAESLATANSYEEYRDKIISPNSSKVVDWNDL